MRLAVHTRAVNQDHQGCLVDDFICWELLGSSKAISVKELEQCHLSSSVAEGPVWERVCFEGWGGK